MTETPGSSEFESLLAAPYEQFDKRSEILASIEAYSRAIPATAGGVVEVPKYTESDMKVLTEAALRLGRREAAEEIARRCELDPVYDTATRYHFAGIAVWSASLEPQEASEPQTDPGTGMDLPPEPRAVKEAP